MYIHNNAHNNAIGERINNPYTHESIHILWNARRQIVCTSYVAWGIDLDFASLPVLSLQAGDKMKKWQVYSFAMITRESAANQVAKLNQSYMISMYVRPAIKHHTEK